MDHRVQQDQLDLQGRKDLLGLLDRRVQQVRREVQAKLVEQDSLEQLDHKVRLVVRGILEPLDGLVVQVKLVRLDRLALLE